MKSHFPRTEIVFIGKCVRVSLSGDVSRLLKFVLMLNQVTIGLWSDKHKGSFTVKFAICVINLGHILRS